MSFTLRPAVRENVCEICHDSFTPKRHTTGKYCGRFCAWLARGGPEFNARVARESAARRGDIQRDKGDGKSYRKVGGRHEHRVIAKKLIGRPLSETEVVHHIDGNHRNNDPSNLEVLTRAEHIRRHGMGLPGVSLAHEPWKARWAR